MLDTFHAIAALLTYQWHRYQLSTSPRFSASRCNHPTGGIHNHALVLSIMNHMSVSKCPLLFVGATMILKLPCNSQTLAVIQFGDDSDA